MYYVYLLISPIDNKVFYIGKGKGNRLKRHVSLTKNDKISNGNVYLYRKIKSILKSYNDIVYEIVFRSDNEIEAYEKEKDLIYEYGLENLCNLSISYNIITDDIKNKISNSVKNLYLYNTDYVKKLNDIYNSEEYRQKQSIAVKNSKLHKEKMSSLEVKSKISKKLKEYFIKKYGKIQNNKVNCYICKNEIIIYERKSLLKDKYYCSKKCRYHIRKSEDYRKMMSESVKNSEKHKLIYTDEFKNNISESSKKWWSSLSEDELNVYKKNMSDSLKNSIKHKEKINSDEYRKNLSNGIKKSVKFKNYNLERKGKKRGTYKESEKNLNRRAKSILVDSENNTIKEFNGLSDICSYFDIKISTASIWLKNEKKIDNLILKRK
jgi:hypothetical protein